MKHSKLSCKRKQKAKAAHGAVGLTGLNPAPAQYRDTLPMEMPMPLVPRSCLSLSGCVGGCVGGGGMRKGEGWQQRMRRIGNQEGPRGNWEGHDDSPHP
jgi:hypothetical protein